MRGLAIFYIFHGLANISVSIENILNDRLFNFLSLSVNQSFNLFGISVGLLFIITGVGIWFKKRYSLYTSILLSCLFCFYLIVQIIYLIYIKEYDVLFLVSIISFFYFVIAMYILRHKSYFQ